jgi:plasmid stabilization system protein ParE
MSRILVTAEAERDINISAEGIAEHSLDTAIRFCAAVRETSDLLSRHPLIGTRRTTSNTRLIGLRSVTVHGFRNYLIFFIPTEQEI